MIVSLCDIILCTIIDIMTHNAHKIFVQLSNYFEVARC